MQKQEISLYNFGGCEIRTLSDEHGNPLFIAADVAKALDYRDAANMIRLLDEWEIKGTHIVSTLGGEQSMTVITEAGIYHAVFASSKKEAVEFRRWVCEDVLPSIRKHGYYIMESRLEEVKAQLANSHKEIARLLDDNAAERTRVSQPARVAEAKAVASANRVRARELEADVAESMVHAAALRVDDAVVENADLRKMRRFLQAELRQANETIVFLQQKLHAAYVAEAL